jgi:hypothetical protein
VGAGGQLQNGLVKPYRDPSFPMRFFVDMPEKMKPSFSSNFAAAFFVFLMAAPLAGKLQASAPADSLIPVVQSALFASVPQTAFADSKAAPVSEKKISLGGAFLRSALIPGWGQKAVGARTSARNFFVAEVALWAGVIAFNVHGNWLEDDYQTLAAQHAAVDVDGKDTQYFVDIGNFATINDYNQSRLQNRDVQSLYDPATHSWRWDTPANQQRFRQLRVDSDHANSNAELVVAAILANHIISGIHAAWLAHRANANAEKPEAHGSIYIPQMKVAPASGMGLRLKMQWKF